MLRYVLYVYYIKTITTDFWYTYSIIVLVHEEGQSWILYIQISSEKQNGKQVSNAYGIPSTIFWCTLILVTKRSSCSNNYKEGKCLVFHVKVLSKFVWLLPSAESLVATRYAAWNISSNILLTAMFYLSPSCRHITILYPQSCSYYARVTTIQRRHLFKEIQ